MSRDIPCGTSNTWQNSRRLILMKHLCRRCLHKFREDTLWSSWISFRTVPCAIGILRKLTSCLPEDLSKQLPSVEDIQKRIRNWFPETISRPEYLIAKRPAELWNSAGHSLFPTEEATDESSTKGGNSEHDTDQQQYKTISFSYCIAPPTYCQYAAFGFGIGALPFPLFNPSANQDNRKYNDHNHGGNP